MTAARRHRLDRRRLVRDDSTSSVPGTTTSLVSSQNPSFTSGADSSVTLTASVTSSGATVGEGTVDFTDGGKAIGGCGAVAVTSGVPNYDELCERG